MAKSISFLPWYTVESKLKVGDYILHPFFLDKPDLGVLVDADLINILQRYQSVSGRSIRSATIVYKDGSQPTDNISDSEMEEVFLLSEVLAFSALAEREFFAGHDYLNRDNLRLVVQRFVNSADEPAVSNRRRDGSRLMGFATGLFSETCPNNVSPVYKGKIDVDFCNALVKLYKSTDPLWDQIYDAILGFNSANTDRQEVRESAEIVHICGSFERLFGWSQNNVVPGFTALLSSVNAPPSLKYTRTLGAYALAAGAHSHREAWIRDFYKTRNELGHGKSTSSHAKTWDTKEHLLLGAFIFPLTLKSFLASKGWYSLSDDDKRRLFRIDYILNVPDIFSQTDPTDPDSFLWNEVKMDALWDFV